MIKSKLLVNSTPQEVRVGVVENNKLAEVYIERTNQQGVVGNIYKGKVTRVLPGMQAAFVDIGLERAAFLYVSDILNELGDAFDAREIQEARRKNKNDKKIEHVLTQGQDVMVQVAKDPISTKGARLTSHVSLPGRNLVYMPTVNHVGVSRKIDHEKERKRLRAVIEETQTLEGGFIIRTAASGQSDESIASDVEYLEKQWKNILRKNKLAKSPALIHEDLDLVERLVRDFFTQDVEEIIVDNKTDYKKILDFMGPSLKGRGQDVVHLYKDSKPLFEHYNLEEPLNKALGKKVWLKSGGYLIIEQTEALTSVDVNTGRFVGSKSLEETVLQTNLEAVDEIVSQLRLRNLGGLIILDIIDMDRRSNREKVYKKLEENLADDKAKTNVLQISELGLVEMTRKRTRESLVRSLCEPCSNCNGNGYHKSSVTIAYDLLRKLEHIIIERNSYENVELCVHPSVGNILKHEQYPFIQYIENKTGRKIVIKEQANVHIETYTINFTGHGIMSSKKEKALPEDASTAKSTENTIIVNEKQDTNATTTALEPKKEKASKKPKLAQKPSPQANKIDRKEKSVSDSTDEKQSEKMANTFSNDNKEPSSSHENQESNEKKPKAKLVTRSDLS
ncbi:MAG TPA: Rne/Rng family ribonuclease [Oligoflexia bacterium]|nr:Rne/Rng family ribonuclease [Oligoflexia bacterium]HMR23891.1 Rne/Rng family ribonuclease [Oligoflexia bacterium]